MIINGILYIRLKANIKKITLFNHLLLLLAHSYTYEMERIST
ncbi:hypothetical protein HMPREF0653_01908 [Prevotella disiens JCM 6334 = ATCC 29426]|uniref:Uncharacterized protein n=1 Tax=Prevotella disiens JCM 6334 = ATCC 29426 TaxID=1235811 RepID=A0ABN0NQQ2_9BACT|nr:hypothetical protein HMPREF0653_01908 [Prevotella disiens JCM 6334 = ATCC 29426]